MKKDPPLGGSVLDVRQKMFKYVGLDQLENLIANSLTSLGSESVDVAHALYRVLSEDVVSPKDLPELNISHADGFAISNCDSRVFKVVSSGVLGFCEAAPVETGHPVPEGAVAVVPAESVRFLDGGRISVPRSYERFHEIVKKGADISRGETLCRKGEVVTPPLARALLELGIEELRVFRRPRVLLIPVGSEFTEGFKRESSSILVKAMCEAVGALVDVSSPLEDSAEAVRKAVEEGIETHDVVATIGGASLGSRDVTLTAVLGVPGSTLLVRGVAVQPGRVTSLVKVREKPVVLLPGFVQSTISGSVFLLQPVIRKLQGAAPRAHYLVGLYKLASDYEYAGRFTSFSRVRFVKLVSSESKEIEIAEAQSPIQKTVLNSHGFVILEGGVTSLSRGSYVSVYRAPGLYHT